MMSNLFTFNKWRSPVYSWVQKGNSRPFCCQVVMTHVLYSTSAENRSVEQLRAKDT